LIYGAVDIVRRRNLLAEGLVISLLSCVVGLSLFRVKQATYIYAAYPALALLIGFGAVALLRRPSSRMLVASAITSLGVAILCYRTNLFSTRESLAISALYLLFGIAGILASRYRRILIPVMAAIIIPGMLLSDVVVVRNTMKHRTYYREIAAQFSNTLKGRNPQDVVFIAPEYAAMEFYTYRSGRYWNTFYVHTSADQLSSHLSGKDVSFYVLDRTGNLYGGGLSSTSQDALRQHTRDVTTALERQIGHKLPVSILVPADSRFLQTAGENL
jgi:hypothetical protein